MLSSIVNAIGTALCYIIVAILAWMALPESSREAVRRFFGVADEKIVATQKKLSGTLRKVRKSRKKTKKQRKAEKARKKSRRKNARKSGRCSKTGQFKKTA